MKQGALQDLVEAYGQRASAAERWRSADRADDGVPAVPHVVGYVGADTPVELITAAGALPVRLAGDPSANSDLGDLYLGRGVDPMTRSVLASLLARTYGDLDRVIVSRDCEGSLRLFYALRELRRVEPSVDLPDTYLVDILHLPHRTTTRYDRARVVQLGERLADWFGRPVSDGGLRAAIEAHDLQRHLLSEVSALRRSVPARLSGSEFLAIVGAGMVMPVEAHLRLLRRLLAESGDLPAHPGGRVYLTGSAHDTTAVYGQIESAGYVVVGEDHDWGDLWFERPVGTPALDALVERYQYNGPSAPRATIGDRARFTGMAAARCAADLLVAYVREADEAPLWDFEAQRRAAGLPAVFLKRQGYGSIDLGELSRPMPYGTPSPVGEGA